MAFKVNVNRATKEDLLKVPGLNLKTVEKILQVRDTAGGLKDHAQLVELIGNQASQEVLTAISEKVAVGNDEEVPNHVVVMDPGLSAPVRYDYRAKVEIDNQTQFPTRSLTTVVEYVVIVGDEEVVRSETATRTLNDTLVDLNISELNPVKAEAGFAIRLRAPNGNVLFEQTYAEVDFKDKTIKITARGSNPAVVATPQKTIPVVRLQPVVHGRILDRNNTVVFANATVVIYGTENPQPASEKDFQVMAYAESDQRGYFTFPSFEDPIKSAFAVIGWKGSYRVDIVFKDRFPEKLILVVDVAPEVAAEDCDCGDDMNMHRKNRILEEHSFYSVIRTSEPQIKAYTISEDEELEISDLSVEFPWLKSSLQIALQEMGTAPANGPMPKYAINKKVLNNFLSKNKLVNNSNVKELLEQNERSKLARLARPGSVLSSGRVALGNNKVIDWDDEPTIYQATEIAHGHILHFKQEWVGDGYSLGDLLYSLPLAPGQKKQIVVYDWDRDDEAQKGQDTSYRESLEASLRRDRDVNDIVRGTFQENVAAHSDSTTSSIAGGLGVGAIIPTPVPIGALIGVGGGRSSAESNATQDSFREMTGNTHQDLSDRTRQSASAVRSQRTTVVKTVAENEKYKATTESVANYNHCHSVTIQYFEVLRNMKIYQKLADVQECLFIPFDIKKFDIYKADRWADILRRYVPVFGLRKGFDAIKRYLADWKNSGFPENTFSEDLVTDFSGDLSLQFRIARPKDGVDEVYLASEWLWTLFSPFSSSDFHKNYLKSEKRKDEVFLSRMGQIIADEFVNRLQVWAVTSSGEVLLPVDTTLISEFRNNVNLSVTLRRSGDISTLRRDQIKGLRIRIKFDSSEVAALKATYPELANWNSDSIPARFILPPNSKVIVRSMTMNYTTPHYQGSLVRNVRVDNDLSGDDDVLISTPLSFDELRMPKQEDVDVINILIDHLNANLEYYHKAIWMGMSAERRFMLLDGILASGKGVEGKSVASVVENKVIGVVGNCMVMPVARGSYIDPSFQYPVDTTGKTISLLDLYNTYEPDPVSISIPTKGVFAEAVMGSCNSCEKIDESRFWRWEQSPVPDSPTAFGAVDPNTDRFKDPGNMDGQQLPNSIINIQNTPQAPEYAGVSAITGLLGKENVFKDMTGLAGTQANAAAGLQQAFSTATSFGKEAVGLTNLALQYRMAKDLPSTLDSIQSAKSKGLLKPEQAQSLTEKAFNSAMGGGPTMRDSSPEAQKIREIKQLQDEKMLTTDEAQKMKSGVIQSMGRTDKTTQQNMTDRAMNVISEKGGKLEYEDGTGGKLKTEVGNQLTSSAQKAQSALPFYVEVPLIGQPTEESCWAASVAMMMSYSFRDIRKLPYTVEEVVQQVQGMRRQELRPDAEMDVGIDKRPELHFFERAISQLGFVDLTTKETVDLSSSSSGTPAISVKQWADWLKKYGPLWVTLASSPHDAHAVVLRGMTGGGASEDTSMHILNPWNDEKPDEFPSKGKQEVVPFSDMMKRFNALDIGNYGNMRIYYIPLDGVSGVDNSHTDPNQPSDLFAPGKAATESEGLFTKYWNKLKGSSYGSTALDIADEMIKEAGKAEFESSLIGQVVDLATLFGAKAVEVGRAQVDQLRASEQMRAYYVKSGDSNDLDVGEVMAYRKSLYFGTLALPNALKAGFIAAIEKALTDGINNHVSSYLGKVKDAFISGIADAFIAQCPLAEISADLLSFPVGSQVERSKTYNKAFGVAAKALLKTFPEYLKGPKGKFVSDALGLVGSEDDKASTGVRFMKALLVLIETGAFKQYTEAVQGDQIDGKYWVDEVVKEIIQLLKDAGFSYEIVSDPQVSVDWSSSSQKIVISQSFADRFTDGQDSVSADASYRRFESAFRNYSQAVAGHFWDLTQAWYGDAFLDVWKRMAKKYPESNDDEQLRLSALLGSLLTYENTFPEFFKYFKASVAAQLPVMYKKVDEVAKDLEGWVQSNASIYITDAALRDSAVSRVKPMVKNLRAGKPWDAIFDTKYWTTTPGDSQRLDDLQLIDWCFWGHDKLDRTTAIFEPNHVVSYGLRFPCKPSPHDP